MLGFSPLGFLPLGFITLGNILGSANGSMVISQVSSGVAVEFRDGAMVTASTGAMNITTKSGGLLVGSLVSGMVVKNA